MGGSGAADGMGERGIEGRDVARIIILLIFVLERGILLTKVKSTRERVIRRSKKSPPKKAGSKLGECQSGSMEAT